MANNKIALALAVIVAVIVLNYIYGSQRQAAAGNEQKLSFEELANYTGHPPGAWGKEAWKLIHMVAINFPTSPSNQDREAFSNFISSLAQVLPCGTCRNHFQQMLAGEFALQPKDLVSRHTVFSWSVKVHNHVNQRLKKSQPESVAHWFKHYTMLRQAD